jgi:gas vesicle protein
MKAKYLKEIELWAQTWRSFLWGLLISLVIGFVYNWNDVLIVLKNWEQLLGSLLGALLPVLIAILWNPVNNKIKKYESVKESLREIEIDTSQIINDICDIRSIYSDFIENICKQVEISKGDEKIGPLLFNAPPKIHIYSNPQLLKYKTGSIYLHNVLIGLEKWTRQTNTVLDNIIESTHDIQKSFGDRFNKLPSPAPKADFIELKNNYNEELLRFADELKSIDKTFDNGLEAVVTAKVCGQKMNNWNRTFIYSTFLKRFDLDYIAYLRAEKGFKSELVMDMYESVQPLIKNEVDELKEKLKEALDAE